MSVERLYPIWFVLCASAGALIGSVTGHGAIHGLVDGMVIAALPLVLSGLAYLVVVLWRPDLPACRCGQCRAKGYEYVGSNTGLQAGVRYRCPRCGRVYELSRGRFDELTEGDRSLPYMLHTKWGRGRAIEAEPRAAGDAAQGRRT